MKVTIHGQTAHILFMWDMNPAEFAALYTPTDNEGNEYDYLGAVFFGNFKLEFIQNNDGGYRNLFLYGRDGGYAYLEDGVPYDELFDRAEDIGMPHRRTFTAFARAIERGVVAMLEKHPELIPEACKATNPDKWYVNSGNPVYTIHDITRYA